MLSKPFIKPFASVSMLIVALALIASSSVSFPVRWKCFLEHALPIKRQRKIKRGGRPFRIGGDLRETRLAKSSEQERRY